MNRPLPSHGTPYRYGGARNGSWAPCRCTACRRAHYRYTIERQLAQAHGTPFLTPAEPVIEHLNTLIASKMSSDLIARRAGVSHSTVRRLLEGINLHCRRRIAEQILSVKPGDFDNTATRPAIGSQRRVRALYVVGHGPKIISPAADVSVAYVAHLAAGRFPTTTARAADGIAKAYRLLVQTPGDSYKAKASAGRGRWHGPLAWDSHTIDDPDALPDVDEGVVIELKRDALAAIRRDEILHLARFGVSPDEIHRRLHGEVGLSHIQHIVHTLRHGPRDRIQKDAA